MWWTSAPARAWFRSRSSSSEGCNPCWRTTCPRPCWPSPAGSVFLSQTLHLLPNHGRAMVIVNAYRMLEAGGNFFLIDEWPARVRPVHDLISALLDSVFHPIGLDELRRFIQTDIRLLVERESHITDIQDSSGRTTHQMYGIRFEKIG